jgi:threonine dehydratase
MPLATPQIKVSNVARLGGKVILHGQDFDSAKQKAKQLAEEEGLIDIPPFDDVYVIAGQGTVATEILQQLPSQDLAELRAVFVCVGGGGLLAGIAVYLKRLLPHVKVVGVETYDADAMTRSLVLGHRVELPEVGLFADGAAVKVVGKETFRICKSLVDEMVLVSTDEVCAAIKEVFEDTRSVVEPAGALGVAGVKKWIKKNGPGGVVVGVTSGANMNFDRLRFVAERADLGENKEALISVVIPEQPGSYVFPKKINPF